MSHLDILLPFGLPQEDLAADLLRELKMPALSTLIGRAKAGPPQVFDAFSRVLPHELWLSRQFGLDGTPEHSPPLAAARMRALGQTPETGIWFILNPAHLHIARDHLVLTDLRRLALQADEARTLFDAAAPLFEQAGKTLLYGDAANWFMRADDWGGLRTSTPDSACGHNIDIWMPQGSGERDWRKLQNEVQMLWHDHPVNQARASNGQNPVNSLWLWGGALANAVPGASRYTELVNPFGWSRDLGGSATRIEARNTGELMTAAPQAGLLVLEQLVEAALAGDWGSWLEQFRRLEADWFAPLLQALQDGKLDQLSLIIGNGARLHTFETSKHALRKFWRAPSLSRLAP